MGTSGIPGAAHIAALAKSNEPQELLLALIAQMEFNDCNGERVVADLLRHRDLWRSVAPRLYGITLRDLPNPELNNDAIYICARQGREKELEALARTWRADEVDWLKGDAVEGPFHEPERQWAFQAGGDVLRVWWD